MPLGIYERDEYNRLWASTSPIFIRQAGEPILLEGFMETSTLPTLHPLRLGELLDQAVRLYRRNFTAFVGIIAIVFIPYSLIQVISSTFYLFNVETLQADPESIFTSAGYWLSFLGILLSAILYFIFVTGLGMAALTNAIARTYLGQKTGILEAYQQLGPSSFKLLIALILFGLLSMAASIWMIVPIVGWLTGPGILIFLGGVVGQIIPAIVVIENLGGMQSIARAWDLSRRRFWWLLGFSVIVYLLNLLVVSGPTLLISSLISVLIGQVDALSNNASIISTLVSSVAGNLINLLVLPIILIAWTLVYFDLRVRTEGFDLALATLQTAEGESVDMSSLPTAAPVQNWLTGDDIGKFAVISLVLIGIYALLVAMVVGLALLMGAAFSGGF